MSSASLALSSTISRHGGPTWVVLAVAPGRVPVCMRRSSAVRSQAPQHAGKLVGERLLGHDRIDAQALRLGDQLRGGKQRQADDRLRGIALLDALCELEAAQAQVDQDDAGAYRGVAGEALDVIGRRR